MVLLKRTSPWALGWAGAAVAVCLLVAGCSDQKKQNASAQPKNSAAKKSQSQKSPKPIQPTDGPAPAKPSAAIEGGRFMLASYEQSAPEPARPAQDQPKPAPAPAAQPAPQPQDDRPTLSEADREALVEKIKQMAIEAQKEAAARAATRPAAPPPGTSVPPPPPGAPVAPTTVLHPGAASQPATASAPAAGCHPTTSTLDLTPPPEGSPQPKLVGDLKIDNKSVWAGKPATFTFRLKNGGEAPLAVHLNPG